MMIKRESLLIILFIFMNSFTFSIAEISNNKVRQENLENTEIKKQSWFEKNKMTCIIAAGMVCFTLAVVHLYLQIFFLEEYMKREREKGVWENKMLATCEGVLLLEKEGREVQDQQYDMQKEQYDMQKEQYDMQKEQYDMQKEQCDMQKQLDKQNQQYEMQKEQYALQKDQYWVQLNQYLTQLGQFAIERRLDHTNHDEYVKYFDKASKEKQRAIARWDDSNNSITEVVLNKLNELEKNKS